MMRISVKVFILGLAVAALAGTSAFSQQKPNAHEPSLGEIARELKAQKTKEPKPALVFTNDNLPSSDEESRQASGSQGKKEPGLEPAKAATSSSAHDEKYYRDRLSTLQSQLDTHKRELDVLQQKLGQNQVQYYADPNKTLQQEFSRGDINKLTGEIDAKKQQIAADEKAIDDLHDQLRREGGDPGWLR